MQETARAVALMTDEEKQALKDKLLPQFATLSRLGNEEKRAFMMRQSASDQLDFSKLNMIMMQELQQLQAGGASQDEIRALMMSYQSGVSRMRAGSGSGGAASGEGAAESSPPTSGAGGIDADASSATDDL
eukprot:CAMPEP_0205923280 /NCGR_PEP_ID=MMETSP1325-20131115/15959_1 /ASSEMBLY_ACC=CAM_ASM_000708 /TAXON_ID=236786 /ORGANISM="Florenciella sp., Strain RCC1007" /LENGTH=130 /DNA_ID=CAMNT_0053291469 /DNA_START=43 /DNA_END=435 /DNA_ORIENTATION=+